MAEQNLGVLVAEITARNEKFDAALRATEARLGSFEAKVTQATTKVETAFSGISGVLTKVQAGFAALAAGAALGGLTSLVKGALDTADSLGDTATKLGLTTDELQEFQFAANLSGVSSEELDAAIVKLNVSIAQSADKNSKAAQSFKSLGLETKNYSSTGDVFAAVMAKVAASQDSVAVQTEQVRDIMGKGGASLLVMANGLEEMRARAHAAGAVLESDLVQQAAALNDEWDIASKRLRVGLLPLLIELADNFVAVQQNAAEALSTFREWGQWLDNADFARAGEDIAALQTKIATLQQTLANLPQRKLTPIEEWLGIDARGNLQAEIERLKQQLKDLQDFRLRAQGGGTPVAPTAPGPGFGSLTTGSDAAAKASAALSKEIERQVESLKEQAAKLNLSGAALADWYAQQRLAQGAGKDEAENLRAAVLELEKSKDARDADTKAKQAATKAAAELAAAEKEHKGLEERLEILKRQDAILDQALKGQLDYNKALLASAAVTDKVKVGDDQLADAISALDKQVKEKTESVEELSEAWKDQVEQLQAVLSQQNDLIDQMEEDNRLNEERARLINEGIAAHDKYADILHRVAVAEEAARLEAAKFNGDIQKQAELNVKSTEALDKASRALDTYKNSAANAALKTSDIEQAITGLLQGTQNIGDIFDDLGQTIGVRMIKGILFGKGGEEGAILDNFNQLLGVDAAGIFGKGGFDLGSLFGGNFLTSADTVFATEIDGLLEDAIGRSGGITESGAAAGTEWGSAFGAAAVAVSVATIASAAFQLKLGTAIGATLGLAVGAYFGGPEGAAIGAQIGGLLGSFFDPFFKHTPTRGTQIRKGIKQFLEDIGASFAVEIESGTYFFEETKKLAAKMFGGDFLAASKQILTEKAGPELAKQLLALGTFLTGNLASEVGKDLEQAGVTFGNMLVANLGIEAIPDAIDEIVKKAQISFADLADKLTLFFEQGKISESFYRDALEGAVDLFFGDLPAAINVSAIALKSFTDDGIFSLSEFEERLKEATDIFDVVAQNFRDALMNSASGEEAARIFGEGLKRGLEQLALDAFIADFIENQLFADIDLSDGLDTAEIDKLKERVRQARIAVDDLTDALGGTALGTNDLVDQIRELNRELEDLANKRIQVQIDLIQQLHSIGILTDLQAIAAEQERLRPLVDRAFTEQSHIGSRPMMDFSDDELQQMFDAISQFADLAVQEFQAYQQQRQQQLQQEIAAIQAALQERIAAINAALQQEIAAIQASLQARIDTIRKEFDERRKVVQAQIDRLQEERALQQELFEGRIAAMQEELRIAQSFQQVANALQQTINSLTTQNSPFSGPERLAFLQRQADTLRQRIDAAKPGDRPELFEQLSTLLQNQLSLGQGFLSPGAFAMLFEKVILELEALRDRAGGEGNKAEDIQRRIELTTKQMEETLQRIDLRIEEQRKALQALAEDENNAIAAAQRDAAARIEAAQNAAAEKIKAAQAAAAAQIEEAQRKAADDINAYQQKTQDILVELAAKRDEILQEQARRIEEQREILKEQLVTQFGEEEAERLLKDPMLESARNLLVINDTLLTIRTLLGDFLANISPAANGMQGMVTSPRLLLVGEKGPEYVSVTPRGGMAGMGGVAVSVSPTYNVSLLSSGNPEEDARRFMAAVHQHGLQQIRGGEWGQEIQKQVRVRAGL